MTGVVVGFTTGLATVAVLGWLKCWSDREATLVQARALRAWEARQCPDRVERWDADDLACAQVVAEAEDITREAAT